MKPLIVIRHGSAGHRNEWDGDDGKRPLDKRGRRQAAGLVTSLAAYDVERILSSPSLRCTQTVAPLAEHHRLEIEERFELAEGASLEEALGVVQEVEGVAAVLCSHGDIIGELLGTGLKKGATAIVVENAAGLQITGSIPPGP